MSRKFLNGDGSLKYSFTDFIINTSALEWGLQAGEVFQLDKDFQVKNLNTN